MNQEIEEFLTYLVAEKGDSIKTIECYKKDLYQFSSFLSDKDASLLSIDDMNDFLSKLKKDGLKNNSIIRKSMSLKGFYKYLKNEEIISIVLSDFITPKKENRLPETLTLSEIEKLLKVIPIDSKKGRLDYTMIIFCFSCGLRVSELVSLRLDSINVKNGYLRVTGKRNRERLLPINSMALDALKMYLNEVRNISHTKSHHAFVHPNGLEVSRQYFFLELKKYVELSTINKKVSPHTLRHSYATILLENGAELKQIQELLGHQDISTTQIYTHISRKKQEEEYQKAMPRN